MNQYSLWITHKQMIIIIVAVENGLVQVFHYDLRYMRRQS